MGGTVLGAGLGMTLGAGFSASGFLRILGTTTGFSVFVALAVGAGLTDEAGAFFGTDATGFERIFLGIIAGFGTAAGFGAGLVATEGETLPPEPLEIVDCKVG